MFNFICYAIDQRTFLWVIHNTEYIFKIYSVYISEKRKHDKQEMLKRDAHITFFLKSLPLK